MPYDSCVAKVVGGLRIRRKLNQIAVRGPYVRIIINFGTWIHFLHLGLVFNGRYPVGLLNGICVSVVTSSIVMRMNVAYVVLLKAGGSGIGFSSFFLVPHDESIPLLQFQRE